MTQQGPAGDGDSVAETVRQGAALRRAGRAAEAEALFQTVLREWPRHAVAMHQLGLVRFAQSDFVGAVELLRAAVELQPEDPSWINDLANALCQSGDLTAAVVQYARALEINPSFAQCHYNLGVALTRQGLMGRAVAHYRSAVALDLRAPELFYNLGVALQDQGKLAEAVASYERAIALQPGHVQAHYNCGNAWLHQGQLAEAIQRFEAAIGLAPDHVAAHYNLAMARMESGQTSEAIRAYRRVLELKPDHSTARHVLATLEGATPERAPAAYVARLFDQYAPTFDQHLVGTLGYDIPNLLARLLANGLGANAPQADILDMGCGTGLFGVAAKPWCRSLVGVDVSPGMLAVAASKSAYDDLVAADLLDHLHACAARAFNAIVAADVLCYLGDLAELFEQAHRVCRADGIFGFSVENDPLATADYLLRSTGRFAHRVGYIRALAQRFGFAERVADQVTVRLENGSPVTGLVFLLAKPG